MARRPRLLLVEDEALFQRSLASHLGVVYEVAIAGSLGEAREACSRLRFDVALCDLHLPDGDSFQLVAELAAVEGTEVIVMTADASPRSAVSALKAGAFDYLNKPFDLTELDLVIAKAVEHVGLRREVAALRQSVPATRGVERIIGCCPSMDALRSDILQVAATPDTTVLVRGETGTGKELVAEAIHHASDRRDSPLIRVNCSSLPTTMIEAEIFGHVRGAFTDAKTSRRGLIEMAHGGTLLLDEIGDMPIELQPKLLRVIESRRVRRLGGDRESSVDVRFVAATNRDLDQLVREGKFREDLLFRLQVFELVAPPLRSRPSEISLLARHLLTQLASRLGRNVSGFTEQAMTRLESYDWPGNVRELRNVIERAIILCRGQSITPELLRIGPLRAQAGSNGNGSLFPAAVEACLALDDLDQAYVRHVYELCDSNKTRAAEVLSISRVTHRERLRRAGVH